MLISDAEVLGCGAVSEITEAHTALHCESCHDGCECVSPRPWLAGLLHGYYSRLEKAWKGS